MISFFLKKNKKKPMAPDEIMQRDQNRAIYLAIWIVYSTFIIGYIWETFLAPNHVYGMVWMLISVFIAPMVLILCIDNHVSSIFIIGLWLIGSLLLAEHYFKVKLLLITILGCIILCLLFYVISVHWLLGFDFVRTLDCKNKRVRIE